MDRIDREIIATLVGDARRSLQDVAARVRLSASATRERLRRLERQGPITGYTAMLDSVALGFPLHAAAEVDMAPGTDPIAFEEGLRALPAVVEALHATGDCDYLVRLHCRDTGRRAAASPRHPRLGVPAARDLLGCRRGTGQRLARLGA
jgi:Lrp/AsnC family leucine-responsive transcriptional regulator